MTALYWAIIGQIFIIMGLLGTVCWAVYESSRKPRSYYFIFLNRLRYIFLFVGIRRFIWAKLYNFFHIIFRSGKRKVFEDHPYNYPWLWLRENKLYTSIFFYIPTTLGIIFELCRQVSDGSVFKKHADLFFMSPIRSVSLLLMLVYLAQTARYWKKMALKQMEENGKIVDKTGKLDAITN